MIQLGPIGGTSDKDTKKVSLRRVSGAQAEGAYKRLGLIKIVKPSAKVLWDQGISLVFVSNNASGEKFFDRNDPHAIKAQKGSYCPAASDCLECDFETIFIAFKSWMRRFHFSGDVAIFVFRDELQKKIGTI